MLLERQKVLFSLVQHSGGNLQRTRLVKLAFLLKNETDYRLSSYYQFLPYHHGPFSFTLFYELGGLEEDGLLFQGEDEIRITDKARSKRLLSGDAERAVISLIRRYREMDLTRLLDDVYERYPWFTALSEKTALRQAKRPKAKPAVYTIGYEGVQVDAVLNTLLHTGITVLYDVRKNPVSRRYGFHKSTLTRLCESVGIEYHHVPDCGVPSEWRENLDSPKAYERLFNRYRTEVLPEAAISTDAIAKDMKIRPAAIMCQEADHRFCHRSPLSERLKANTGLEVNHLRVSDD